MTNYYTLDQEVKATREKLNKLQREQDRIKEMEREERIEKDLAKVDKRELLSLLDAVVKELEMYLCQEKYYHSNKDRERSKELLKEVLYD